MKHSATSYFFEVIPKRLAKSKHSRRCSKPNVRVAPARRSWYRCTASRIMLPTKFGEWSHKRMARPRSSCHSNAPLASQPMRRSDNTARCKGPVASFREEATHGLAAAHSGASSGVSNVAVGEALIELQTAAAHCKAGATAAFQTESPCNASLKVRDVPR